MSKLAIFFCATFTLLGCANNLKQSEITLHSSKLIKISGSASIQIETSKEQDKSYVFDESLFRTFTDNCIAGISHSLNGENIEIRKGGAKVDYKLKIDYQVDEEAFKHLYNFKGGYAYLKNLFKVKTKTKLMNAHGETLLEFTLDNLSNIERKGKGGVTVESMPDLGRRIGKTISLILLNVKPNPAAIKGEWINIKNNASLAIRSASDKLVGFEDEIYVKGDTVVKIGEVEWLHVDKYNAGNAVTSRYSGKAKHINKVTDDFTWMNAEFDIIGNILFIKHSDFANEETAVYVKSH